MLNKEVFNRESEGKGKAREIQLHIQTKHVE
jgi:hypothetical protein